MKSWGEIFRAAMNRGYDCGYSAWLADQYCKRMAETKMIDLRVGDIVEYRGECWEIGFINKHKWKGTLRLQKSGDAWAKQINWVDVSEVKLHLMDEKESGFSG